MKRYSFVLGIALCFLLTGCPQDKNTKPAKPAYHGPRHYKCGDKHPNNVMVKCEYDAIYKGEPRKVLAAAFPGLQNGVAQTTLWKAGDRRGRYVVFWDNIAGYDEVVEGKAFYPAPPVAGE